MEHTGFPSDETLAAFLDGGLDPETRRRVIEHMTTCDECYSVVAGGGITGAATQTESPERTRSAQRRTVVIYTASIAAACIAFALLLSPLRSKWQPAESTIALGPELRKIAEAAPSECRVETRISGFNYPPRRVTRSGSKSPLENSDYWKLLAASGQVARESKAHPTVENLHAVGVAHLLLQNWDDAVLALEDAVHREAVDRDLASAIQKSRDAALLNDLASAYYERGSQMQRASDYVVAFQCVDRAAQLHETTDIAWNRALILEALSMKPEAAAAWRDYLILDSSSPWAVEARRHMAALNPASAAAPWNDAQAALLAAARRGDSATVAQIVAGYPQQARLLIDQQIGSTDDGVLLAIATALETRGDSTSRDLLLALTQAPPNARTSYVRGAVAYREHRTEEALADLTNTLAHAPPQLRLHALFLRARVFFANGEATQAFELINKIKTDAAYQPIRFVSLTANLNWLAGLVAIEKRHAGEAFAAYDQASRLFGRLGETENMGVMAGLRAEALQTIGARDQAWEARVQALSALSGSRSRVRLYVALQEATQSAIREPLHTAFAAIATERLLRIASAEAAPEFVADAWTWRALALLRQSNYAAAADAILAASRHLPDVDEGVRRRSRARIEWARAQIWDTRDPSVVTAAVTEALAETAASGDGFRTADLYLLRGRAHRQKGDLALARADFQRGIATVDAERSTIDSERFRTQFFDVSNGLFAGGIEASVAVGDWRDAFCAVERYRARSIADSMNSTRGRDCSISDLESRLDTHSAILEYFALDNELCIWVVRRGGLVGVKVPIGKSELLAKVDRLALEMRDAGYIDSVAEDLYSAIISPVEYLLEDISTVGIAPDLSLLNVPFTALRNPVNRRFLVERYVVVIVPSATTAVQIPNRAGRVLRAVVLGNPAYGSDAGALRGAQEESLDVCQAYARAATRVGDHFMTPIEFLTSIRDCDVLHVATHAIRMSRFHSPSLLLWPGRPNEGLSASDLENFHFSQAPLVVLAACETEYGAESPSEGHLSLGRAFLRAGARNVIVTTAPLDDETSVQLFSKLHRLIASGINAAVALRQVQLDALASRGGDLRRSITWSSIQINGNL